MKETTLEEKFLNIANKNTTNEIKKKGVGNEKSRF